MDFVAWEVLLVGVLIVLSLLSKAALGRLDLLGYLLVGVGLQMLDGVWPVVTTGSQQLLTFLAEFGVVALLFRVGLECNPKHLFRRFSGATVIWIVNVTASMGTVLGTALVLLDWALLPSLFAAVALTAVIATTYDVLTDHRGVADGYWSYTDAVPGPRFKSVPWWNYAAWFGLSFLTALLAVPFL